MPAHTCLRTLSVSQLLVCPILLLEQTLPRAYFTPPLVTVSSPPRWSWLARSSTRPRSRRASRSSRQHRHRHRASSRYTFADHHKPISCMPPRGRRTTLGTDLPPNPSASCAPSDPLPTLPPSTLWPSSPLHYSTSICIIGACFCLRLPEHHLPSPAPPAHLENLQHPQRM